MTGTYMMFDPATKRRARSNPPLNEPLARPQYWFALGCTIIIALTWVVGRLV